jgi:hypothetical protein
MRLSTFILVALFACHDPVPGFDAGVDDAVIDIPALAPDLTRQPPALVPLAQAPECPGADPPPCVVEVVSFADEPAQIGYRLCCPQPGHAIAALAVDSGSGPWGDVTKWAVCGWGYVEEFTDFDRAGTTPWAVLDTYNGFGGPIAECASANAPSQYRRPRRLLDAFMSSR